MIHMNYQALFPYFLKKKKKTKKKTEKYIVNRSYFITKTCLYNFDPLKPHFYTLKPGFTELYIIFFISAQKHRLWVLIRTAEAVLTSTHNLCFEQKYEKYQNILSKKLPFLVVKFSVYLNRRVFVMLRVTSSIKASVYLCIKIYVVGVHSSR